MSDDLLRRARRLDTCIFPNERSKCLCGELADRIEKLEEALREIAAGYETPWSTSTVSNMLNVAEILSDRINIARKALEGKDG